MAEGEVEVYQRPQPVYQRPQESGRDDRRPPPPYPGSGKPAVTSAQQPSEPPLWRLQRHEEDSGTAAEEGGQQASGKHPARPKKLSSAYSLPASEQEDKQNLGEASWLDWQRERWQIWELLSTDNPDALPETLV